ncbi:MAG: WbqC family protein [Chloroflexota bacterium]|nr:MAG: WbqC family protein [Chloroflexota bacterium]
MIVAVHQPNYLPWIGYFHKMAHSDVFVLLDTVQFPRGTSVANRNRIKTAQGVLQLTMPVSIPKGRQGKVSYAEVRTAANGWQRKHLKSIQMAYSKAPYFGAHFDEIDALLHQSNSLLEINLAMIRYCAEALNIHTQTLLLSQLSLNSGAKSELIVNICRELGASQYLSGQGARKYNDPAMFSAAGVDLIYQDFTCPVYPQLHGEFVPNLSVVDLLFNCGGDGGQFVARS